MFYLSNQRAILLTQFFTFAANALLGMFLPFFIMRTFGLEIWQVMLLFAGVYAFWGLLALSFVRLVVQLIGARRSMMFGGICNMLFLLLMSWQPDTLPWLGGAMVCYSLYTMLFWVNNNVLTALHTSDRDRGVFFGNMQAVMVATNILGPAITGLLFWQNAEQIALYIALGFQFLALGALLQIGTGFAQQMSWQRQKLIGRDLLGNSAYRAGLVGNTIQGTIMQMGWPFYFQFAVGSFAIMGILASIGGAVELVTSKLWGWIIDRKKISNLQLYAIWGRAVDFWLRTLYMFFSPVWLVGLIQVAGTLLGPPYLIQISKRHMSYTDRYRECLYDYFLVFEVLLSVCRVLIVLLLVYPVYLFGPVVLGWFMVLGGLSAFLLRRF